MNPSPAAIAAIEAYVAGLAGGWAGNTDAQVVAAANDPTVANPTPQGTVPTPYTVAALLAPLSQASIQSFEGYPGISDLYNDILAQSSSRVAAAITLMAAAGRITSAEATSLQAVLSATGPDPTYQAQIGWAQANLGRPLDTNDSAVARVS